MLGLVMTLPECPREPPPAGSGAPFLWDQDRIWHQLEGDYRAIREEGCSQGPDADLASLGEAIDRVDGFGVGPDDPRWVEVEDRFFRTAARVAACDSGLPDLIAARSRLRRIAKDASTRWPRQRSSRDRLYRLLYGTRIAVEEVMLQSGSGADVALSRAEDVPSITPSKVVHGVRIHSGDLLLSRGGAPTSAFIARGNDYPGNFSHVALAHVDETGDVSLIESHIERGVAIADVDAYLADKKLRIAVLRLRADHSRLQHDPMLPHRAATAALEEAHQIHIPYDFAMDFRSDDERFCSEVASAAYEPEGISLWRDLSTFSSPGLTRWMAAFGVTNFETQAPSDLEYDPQLSVVAEWRDLETLFDDHVDNAVIDAMLETAEAGAEVGHAWWMLPIARVAKACSVLLNLWGSEGPVPEGMSATVALRARWLAQRHAAIKAGVLVRARAFEIEYGYRPPYWTLVDLARDSISTLSE